MLYDQPHCLPAKYEPEEHEPKNTPVLVGNIITHGESREFKTLQQLILLLKTYLHLVAATKRNFCIMDSERLYILSFLIFVFSLSPFWQLGLTRLKSTLIKKHTYCARQQYKVFLKNIKKTFYQLFLNICTYKGKILNEKYFSTSHLQFSVSKTFLVRN